LLRLLRAPDSPAAVGVYRLVRAFSLNRYDQTNMASSVLQTLVLRWIWQRRRRQQQHFS